MPLRRTLSDRSVHLRGMNNLIKSLLLALSAGLLVPIQGSINSQIGKTSGQYAMIIGWIIVIMLGIYGVIKS